MATQIAMIVSFRHKGLQELFEMGRTARLPQERVRKIRILLLAIDSADSIAELFTVPAYRLHRLKRPPFEGYYSMDVSGNFRLVFMFDNGNAFNLDYLDTH